MDQDHRNSYRNLNITNVKDYPMTKEQINEAENILDKQRLRDDGKFRVCQAPSLQPQTRTNHPPPTPSPSNSNSNSKSHSQSQGNTFYPWCEPPLPEFLDPSKTIDLKLLKNTKKDSRCYTCKPRGDIKKHIICENASKTLVFHHDMHRRPIIMLSPKKHITSMDDMSSEELIDMFKSIKDFVTDWNINDYQVSYTSGKWQTSEHFHCKIKVCDKMILRMRRDHFSRIKLCDRYLPQPQP